MDRRPIAAIFIAAFVLCALLTKTHVASWNDGSRFATIDALTAARTFQIDGSPYAARLGDKIRFRGRTYSDKPPLLAVLGTAVAFALEPAGVTLRRHAATAIYLITLLTVGVAFAVGCCYVFAFARLLGFPQRTSAAAAALAGVGTLSLTYAVVLVNHVPSGACVLAGCYHAARGRDGARAHALGAGFAFGLAYAFDASAILLAVGGVALLWGAPASRWVLAVLGGIPLVALQVAYNLHVSGSYMPPALNASVWNDPSLPLYSWSSQVFAVYSPAAYAGFAANLLVGSRGLFTYTPLMLLVAYGVALLWRAGGLRRRLALAITGSTAVFFAAILFLQNDTISSNFGERRYVDIAFLAGTALAPALAGVRGALGTGLARLVIAASVAITALGTVAPFGGRANESGFAFAGAEFVALARRAPIQAALDVVLLAIVLLLVMRFVPLGAAATAVPRRG
ncbi:MAG TPA: hypothetical protein VHT53_00840 [Candidatus Elarobacter sp.]|nr:hypothetical protein [Candidatus Elarobacter sp.]